MYLLSFFFSLQSLSHAIFSLSLLSLFPLSHKAGNKRSIHHNSRERSHLSSVYNKPYIGQHDQGIPFTHPLKRIKTGS